jgi:predicted permease
MLFWRRKAREQELEREMRAHLEREAEEQQEAGLSVEDAHYAARRAFGNRSLIKEDVRTAWGWVFLETLAKDLRYTVRSLRGSPVFALIAISSLGLGIGANTAIFSFVNALLLKHLPVPEPAQLVQLAEYENGKVANSAFSFPMIAELEKRNQAFDGMAGSYSVRVNMTENGIAAPLKGEVVTGEYFRTLRIKPALGRLLVEDDVTSGAGNPVCVISYSTWQTRFGGDPGILGRKLSLNAHPYTVVGVTEKGFFGSQLQSRIEMQLPVSRMGDFMGGFFASGNGAAMWKSPGFNWLELFARLKPGLSAAQAEAATIPLAGAIRDQLANGEQLMIRAGAQRTYRLTDASQGPNPDSTYTRPLTVLMGVVALVLLVACTNVANLLLARANARAKEFAVRLSLGASRWRLVRQLMVESLAIAGCGGLLGIVLAFWIVHTLLLYLNAGQSGDGGLHVALDPLVICFAILLSLLTSVVFGLLPAMQSAKPNIIPELKGAQASSGRVQTRKLLLVSQIALSMMILFAAGLLTRTLSRLKTVDLGFDPARVITLKVDPAMNGYAPNQSDRVFDEILSRLRTQSGVVAASLATVTPLEGGMISLRLGVPGRLARSSDQEANFNMVSPNYFKTLNQPMLGGRDFGERDTKKTPRVAVVNELFAAQYFPGQNPIGQRFQMGGDIEIVGLVKNAHYQTLRERLCPLVYLPVKQTQSSGYKLLVRSNVPARTAIADTEAVIRSVDSKLPIYDVRELQDDIERGISSEYVLSFLSMLFSALATLLCSIGIYGLIAYAVSRRTREIGVRLAIGAQKTDVAKLFLRESIVIVGAGIALGVPLALVSTRVLQGLLYGVEPADVPTLVTTIAIFLMAGLVATFLPTLRATRIEPLQALRYE